MVDCWNHTTATLLGDGSANMGLAPGTLPAVALAEDIQLEVAQPAAVSTVGRGYRNSDNGTIVKFVAYGLAKEPDSMGSWYRDSFAELGQDDRVREHVFGTTVGKKVQVGYLITLPAEHQQSYDWLLELWFDTRPTPTPSSPRTSSALCGHSWTTPAQTGWPGCSGGRRCS